MATIKKKISGKQEYFYLEYAFRKNGAVGKKELYLGKHIPKDIDKIKADFLAGIYKEKWHGVLDKIKKGYLQNLGRMPPSVREKETETFMVKFTYNTQRIEGSTLTFKETADLLERGITPTQKPMRDVKETEAHREVFYEMMAYKKDLNLQAVLEWHKRMFQVTKPDVAGKIRQYQVAISGSKFTPPFPAEVYPLLKDFFRWYEKVNVSIHPVELAALVHLKIVTIHPFGDGNGRISRLMMNFVLNRHGYPMLDIPYKGRAGYYGALERAQVKGNENIFVQWFFRKYVKENRRYARR
jgi:Fic family protein